MSETQKRPRNRKAKSYYVINVPEAENCGGIECQHKCDSCAHAALNSIVNGMKCAGDINIDYWFRHARRQLSRAINKLKLNNLGKAAVTEAHGTVTSKRKD